MTRIGIDIGGSSVKAVRLGEPRVSARVAHDGSTKSAVTDAVAIAATRVGVAGGDTVGQVAGFARGVVVVRDYFFSLRHRH